MGKTLAAIVLAACATPTPTPTPPPRCALPSPVLVKQEGGATLERWDVPAADVLVSATLPDDAGYARFRGALRGVDVIHPVADPPDTSTDALREVWRREDLNLATAYAGHDGAIRPIHCLEALLFAKKHARQDELTTPTEFGALVLKKTIDGQPRLRIYFTSSDREYPPPSMYGIAEATADRAAGWALAVHLHNHTIRTHAGAPALGVTAPSTNDVRFLRGLADDLGLAAAWVTNGVFTIEIPAASFAHYQEPPP